MAKYGAEFDDRVPLFWRTTYLKNDDITFSKIVGAFVDGLPGMAAVDVANCLIHLMIFCNTGQPTELQQATEYLTHANLFCYGVNPNWNAGPIKGENIHE